MYKTLADSLNIDLAGFQLAYGYFLELEHGLMGFFPAIFSESKDIVLCTDLAVLAEVEKLLPKRHRQMNKILMIVNTQEKFGFNLTNSPKTEDIPYRILDMNEFKKLTADGSNPFRWAPGLLALCNDEYPASVVNA